MAEISGTTVRALRYYEEAGLIRPCRSRGNARLYETENRTRVSSIVVLRSLGLSIDEIRSLLPEDASCAVAKAKLVKILGDRLKSLQRQAAEVMEAINDVQLS